MPQGGPADGGTATTPPATRSLEGLTEAAHAAGGEQRRLPPVHLWNPAFCGDLDMRIARDGTWFYNGTPIGRPALVRLFASILRKDEDRYVLVTPVEKVGIKVEDVPFIATSMRREAGPASEGKNGQSLLFETNMGDVTRAGSEHPLRFERGAHDGVKP